MDGSLVLLASVVLYAVLTPSIIVRDRGLPPGGAVSLDFPAVLPAALLAFLCFILLPKTRMLAFKSLIWMLLFVVAALPGIEVVVASRAPMQTDIFARLKLASMSLLYCIGLVMIFAVLAIVQAARTSKQAKP